MSNRSAISVAALFASILAGANLTSVTDTRAQAAAAADNCLTAPKGATPAGSHWFYRLERGTKRQCWYLRDEKSARAAPQDSSTDAAPDSAAADPAPPPPRPVVRKSVANAHAELPAAQQRVEQEPAAVPEPRTVGMAPAAIFQNSPAANLPTPTTPSSTVATRWPDSSEVSPSNSFRTAAAEPQAAPPENNQAAAQPAPAPVALAAADSSMAKQSASMQMLFLVMAGALALAGITASLIFRFGRRRARRRPEVRHDRRAIWDQIHNERSSPSMLPDEDVAMWRRDEPYDPRAPDDPQRRVTEMLSRLARSAQN